MNSVPQVKPQVKHIIDNNGLSREADSYLRVTRNLLRGEGMPSAQIAERLNAWCDGYRAYGEGKALADVEAGEMALGWEYAQGEYAWNRCMEIESLQNSREAANYGSLF